jgi:hypothetical protein
MELVFEFAAGTLAGLPGWEMKSTADMLLFHSFTGGQIGKMPPVSRLAISGRPLRWKQVVLDVPPEGPLSSCAICFPVRATQFDASIYSFRDHHDVVL